MYLTLNYIECWNASIYSDRRIFRIYGFYSKLFVVFVFFVSFFIFLQNQSLLLKRMKRMWHSERYASSNYIYACINDEFICFVKLSLEIKIRKLGVIYT